ncbi:phosphoglycerate mutase-like protein [Testicularia cyperi]|uniref:Phosphoglycerate mutase-like protein n=1 Tax=Testicularia cyperi TaxID=1882483 RepID=A0A317XL04_9BASI|nr:phosphoglycerate mutase-like protein [Testicularia cyperi]
MVDIIYICRHGFRMNWVGAETFLPTGRPRDPVLTAHGLNQARDLASYLASLPEEERPQLIVSSPYYRCLQTSRPTAELLKLELVAEPGLSEWFPTASPDSGVHPSPASAVYMKEHIPELSLSWDPMLYPDTNGESISELHARARNVLDLIQTRCDQLGVKRVLICSHAATIIAMGRALLNDDRDDQRSKFIGAGTASLSKYVRNDAASPKQSQEGPSWTQELNGDASFLVNGVEREWHFGLVPDNVTEDGMGKDWSDPEAPQSSQPAGQQVGLATKL